MVSKQKSIKKSTKKSSNKSSKKYSTSNSFELTNDFLKSASLSSKKLSGSKKALQNAIIKNGINNVSLNHEIVTSLKPSFSIELETGKVTYQKKSGRCWMFAGTNVCRYHISKELNLPNFELSQIFIQFYDLLEKSNTFLELIVRTKNEKIDSRIVSYILDHPIGDGGFWEYFVNIVNKYGLVPKQAMKETHHSEDTLMLTRILDAKLRLFADELRTLLNGKKVVSDKKISELKNKQMKEIYSLLVNFLGKPPEKFTFEYKNKDDKFHRTSNLSPIQFRDKFLNIDLNDYVPLYNAPLKSHPFGKVYELDYGYNMVGGKKPIFYNVDISYLKEYSIAQLEDEEPVWFGSGVRHSSNRDLGLLDADLYSYEESLGTKLTLSKEQLFTYRDSLLDHAMVLTGVNLIHKKPNRWKVENSWGDEIGNKGYFVMGDSWFTKYLSQVIIHKKYLSKKLLTGLNKKPVKIMPWDILIQ